ncbi:cysteine hydrolase family protein [Aspergillus glaucus CBS 516.65]|uniref:Isochorismatase-like domain-containing protein n=1 Tax=Aspergillus glaucus CBS 516.65 TaxID=1160497 RepID=A0A1L9VCD1_ASPGL|nr:hypothetical protein ASPGLDRAFT_68460 [Aspergillus glaucus CBS 516.65]OJJ81549.1 hypothetical protein ASPGLDRAFT_68460 [Aspergillus glaucus CBS 516.65]
MLNTALLVLDIQNGILDRLGTTITDDYLQRLSTTLTKARAAGVKIIYITTSFRPAYQDLHLNNSSTATIKSSNKFIQGDPSTQIHPAVSPDTSRGDTVVNKCRVSAFAGTDLELVLRCLDVRDDLVVCGLSTSGAVLSTVRQAADLDYRLTVLRDLCLDRDDEVHGVLMDRVLVRQARIVDSDEWLDFYD